MTSSSAAGLPLQPLSQAAVVNARIRQLMDQDLGDINRSQQYADLLEDWARATYPCSNPVRAA